MARNKTINLLPPELAVKGGGRALFLVKSLAVSLTAGLLVVLAIGGGALFLFDSQLKDLQTEKTDLTRSVRSMEQTESGLVLTRDRLEKIDKVIGARQVEERFDKQRLVLSYARDNVRFRESLIDGSESNLVLESPSSVAVSDMFDVFFSNNNFNALFLHSLQFSPFVGYRIELGVF